jgi:hypothetical protein
MIVCAAGDIHGALDRMYEDVLAFEASLGVRFEHVLHVGDFGVWPDPDRVDRATRDHEGAGDFRGGSPSAALHRARPCSSRATTRTSSGSPRSRAPTSCRG